MKLNEMYPSRYVKGEDLGGKAFTVTISDIEIESMRPDPRSPEVDKYVLFTREGRKGIVLGKTLAYQIAEILGSDDTEAWSGRQITIYGQPVTVAGVPRVAIRARAAAVPQPANGAGHKDDF